MAETIKMQFGMLSQVGPGNMYYMGCRCHHRKGHSWSVWPTEKAYNFWGLCKRV